MSAVDDAIAFLETELAIRGPQYEGLKDYARLNIQPETLAAVQELLQRFAARMDLVSTNRALLVKLRDHPDFDIQQVSAAVHADLQDQEATITAALAMFASDPVATLGLSASAPETK